MSRIDELLFQQKTKPPPTMYLLPDDGFTPQEVEFMAEESLVFIVPKFRMEKLKLLEVLFVPNSNDLI